MQGTRITAWPLSASLYIAKKHGAAKPGRLIAPRSLLLASTLALLLLAYQERGKGASSKRRNFGNCLSRHLWVCIM
jgi:hypothetical protein